jgi:DNA-binding MarR family transcriptional regulator
MFEGTLATMSDATASVSTRLPYGVLLSRLGNEATAGFRRALRPLGLGAQEFIVLKQVQAMEPTAQGGVGDALGMDYSNLASLVAVLCDRDLLERERDASDRRRYILRVSETGAAAIEDADAAIAAHEEEMISVLDEEERVQLWELLRRVADGARLCPGSAQEACNEVEAAEACDEAEIEAARETAAAKECLEAALEADA